jgi:tRNA(Ile)-lysidine synthase
MASGEVDAVATAHTRDDQAETVLAKFLRGAWTEGLSGIHPVIEFPRAGFCVRCWGRRGPRWRLI